MILVVLTFFSILFFLPGLHDSFGLAKIAYLSLLAPLTLASLCLLFFSGRQVKIPLAPLIVSYILILILTMAPYTHESIAQVSLDLTGILFFLYVVNRVRVDSIRPCIVAYVLIVLIMLLFSLIAWRWPQLAITSRPFTEATMGNAKYPALLVFTALPLAFYLGGNMVVQWQKILFTYIATAFIIYLIVSSSRMVLWVPIIIIVVLLLFGTTIKNTLIKIAVILVAFFCTVGGGTILYRILTPDQKQGVVVSIQDRLDIWKNAEPMIATGLPFGIGRGTFQLHYSEQLQEYLTTHAHNDYLELLIETGPFGFLLFVSIGLYVLNLPTSIQGNYIKASVLAVLLSALFWFPFEIAPMAVSYWIFLGLIYVDSKANI